MPCNQIRLSRIKLTDQTDRGLIEAAITTLGGKVLATESGVLRFSLGGYIHTLDKTNTLATRDATLADRLKVAYGVEVVKSAAKKFGWQATPVAGKQNTFAATRRY